jgi:hypothetical protein
MNRAAEDGAAGGRAAMAAECVTDPPTLARVAAALRPRTAAVDTLSRHVQLQLPASTLERRTHTPLRRGAR